MKITGFITSSAIKELTSRRGRKEKPFWQQKKALYLLSAVCIVLLIGIFFPKDILRKEEKTVKIQESNYHKITPPSYSYESYEAVRDSIAPVVQPVVPKRSSASPEPERNIPERNIMTIERQRPKEQTQKQTNKLIASNQETTSIPKISVNSDTSKS